ncbi:MAG: hypothetical protein H8E73_09625 [Planctomycetes bacterium]|nr:hypothetical protein [Planctomycetota bacterium]
MTDSQTKKKIPCEVYSRIVGYLRPVHNWNKGKQQEFADRRPYAVRHVVQTESESEGANANQGVG